MVRFRKNVIVKLKISDSNVRHLHSLQHMLTHYVIIETTRLTLVSQKTKNSGLPCKILEFVCPIHLPSCPETFSQFTP